jgi:ribosome biogenesis GTPase A
MERYRLSGQFEDKTALLDEIGTNRGFLLQGGEINYDKIYDIVLREIRDLKIGRISFEAPGDLIAEDSNQTSGL